MTTRLINMYSNGGQIPAHKLMEYMDMTLNRLSDKFIKDEINNIYNDLIKILQPIEYKKIKKIIHNNQY